MTECEMFDNGICESGMREIRQLVNGREGTLSDRQSSGGCVGGSNCKIEGDKVRKVGDGGVEFIALD